MKISGRLRTFRKFCVSLLLIAVLSVQATANAGDGWMIGDKTPPPPPPPATAPASSEGDTQDDLFAQIGVIIVEGLAFII